MGLSADCVACPPPQVACCFIYYQQAAIIVSHHCELVAWPQACLSFYIGEADRATQVDGAPTCCGWDSHELQYQALRTPLASVRWTLLWRLTKQGSAWGRAPVYVECNQ